MLFPFGLEIFNYLSEMLIEISDNLFLNYVYLISFKIFFHYFLY